MALGYKESISKSVTLQVREVEYQNIIYRVHALHCASDKAFAWEKNNHKEKQGSWKQCFWNNSGKKKFYHRKFSMVMFPSKSRQSYQSLLQHFRKCRFPLWKQKCPDSFRFFTPLILKRQSWELVLTSFEQVMKILTLTQKKLKSVFWGNIPFPYPFHRAIGQKKPHDKTTEKVKILLLTVTILNTGNYRIIKRGLKNFAKKENFGTDKQSNKIQAKTQDKLYLQDLFGNSGYNDWFEWTKEKTFILNWTRTIELMNLRNLTMTTT